MFGSSNLFGSTTTAQPATSLFSSPQPQSQQQGGLFGSTTTAQPATSLFSSPQPQTQQQGGLFGSTTTAQPATSLFSSPQPQNQQQGGWFGSTTPGGPVQQLSPQTSLFATPNTGLFGSTQPNTSLFGTAAGGTTSSLFGKNPGVATNSTTLGGTSTSVFQPLAPQLLQSQQNLMPLEVQQIVANLSNADLRSCQVLTDLFNRLKHYSTQQPTLIAFTYDAQFDANIINEKRTALEQQLMQLNDPSVIECYTVARRKNPDPAKYSIVGLQNFGGLVKRAEIQLQHVDRINSVLLECKTRQERIGNQMKISTLKRLEDVSKRQKCLQSSLIRSIGLLEEYAIRTSRAQLDVTFLRKLQSDISTISDELYLSSAGRPKLNEISNRLSRIAEQQGIQIKQSRRKQAQASSQHQSEHRDETLRPSGDETQSSLVTDTSTLSERDFKVIFNIIRKQQNLFETLDAALQTDLLKAKRLLQLSETQNQISNHNSYFIVPLRSDNRLSSDSFLTPSSTIVANQLSTPKRLF